MSCLCLPGYIGDADVECKKSKYSTNFTNHIDLLLTKKVYFLGAINCNKSYPILTSFNVYSTATLIVLSNFKTVIVLMIN